MNPKSTNPLLRKLTEPLAITMWDFSWLERRWSGAGYEDWDVALDGLLERGYNAVRIDAYPHLVSAGPEKVWELLPEWHTNVWGAPSRCRVRVLPELLEFVGKCKARGIWVGLSTWFRQDVDDQRLTIASPGGLAAIWLKVLHSIEQAGLMDAILYLDPCNEWPQKCWAPFFTAPVDQHHWQSPTSFAWQEAVCALVRCQFPDLPMTFSNSYDPAGDQLSGNPQFLDFLEPHIWMASGSEYYQRLNYNYERFDFSGYDRLARFGKPLYDSDPQHWNAALVKIINLHADWSRRTGKPLITTECWGLVDFKDAPMLEWGWVKDLCVLGVETAVSSGQWAAMATSNFCGPQFHGMWRDINWHQHLTKQIRSASLPSL